MIAYLERDLRPKAFVTEILHVAQADSRIRVAERSKITPTPGGENEHCSVSYFRFDDEGNIAEVWYGAEQEPLETPAG